MFLGTDPGTAWSSSIELWLHPWNDPIAKILLPVRFQPNRQGCTQGHHFRDIQLSNNRPSWYLSLGSQKQLNSNRKVKCFWRAKDLYNSRNTFKARTTVCMQIDNAFALDNHLRSTDIGVFLLVICPVRSIKVRKLDFLFFTLYDCIFPQNLYVLFHATIIFQFLAFSLDYQLFWPCLSRIRYLDDQDDRCLDEDGSTFLSLRQKLYCLSSP